MSEREPEQRFGVIEGVDNNEVVIYDKENEEAWLQVPEELVVEIDNEG